MGFAPPTFETIGNCLRVGGELGPDEEKRFELQLEELKGRGEECIFVDMADVTYISSGYVRLLASAIVDAKKKGNRIVIRASRRVMRLLHMGGLDRIGEMKLISDE